MRLLLDEEQLRVLNWRTNNSDIAALEGPPGCGKTTVGSALAVKLIAEGIAKRVLLVAYTNAAANEFGWELFHILGPSASNLCIRTGNPTGVDPTLPIPFSRSIDIFLKKKIVISTNLSLKRLPTMRFDNTSNPLLSLTSKRKHLKLALFYLFRNLLLAPISALIPPAHMENLQYDDRNFIV
jgi:hypothetical protein